MNAYRPDNYKPGDGGRYPFIKQEDFPTLEERIELAKDNILSNSLTFASSEFKDNFWTAFCAEYLMREIEYETTNLFIFKLNQRIKNLLPRYNILYNAIQEDLEPYVTYRKMRDRGLNEKVDKDENGNSNQINNSGSKTVFEDTPYNKLLNTDYATNINNNNSNSETDNTYKSEQDTNRSLSEGIVEEGFTKPKIELLSELFEKLQDLIVMMVKEVGEPLFLKVFN